MTHDQHGELAATRPAASAVFTEVFPGLRARVRALIQGSAVAQWFIVFVPVVVLYLLCMRVDGFSMSADPSAVTPAAWGLAHHGSPIIAKQDWPSYNPWFLDLGGGQVVSRLAPGLVYLATPFYWVFPDAGPWDVYPGSIAAALITAGAVATFGLLIRRLLGPASGPRVGLAAAYIGGLATTTWAVAGTQLFPHGPDELLLVLAMCSLAAGRSAAGGLAFGLAMLIRPPLAVVAAVMGLAQSWAARRIIPALLIGLLTAAGLAGFLLYSYHFWSSVSVGDDPDATMNMGVLNPSSTHGYLRSMTDWSPGTVGNYLIKITGALVSPGRGLLIGAPFLLLLLSGLRRGWRAAPIWVRAAAVAAVVYLLVQLKAQVFTGGSFFWSYRYPLEALTLCAPLLVLSWQRWTARTARRRAWFGALVVIAIGMQAFGAVLFHGPYPDTPWTFDNFGAVLTSASAPAGYLLLADTAIAAGLVLWLGLRRRPTATSQ